MEKNRGEKGQFTGGSIVQPPDDKPTYSDLGIDKTSASREQLVKRGEWLDWLAENCPEITRTTAWNYMKLYEKANSNVQLIEHLTVMQAYKALGKSCSNARFDPNASLQSVRDCP